MAKWIKNVSLEVDGGGEREKRGREMWNVGREQLDRKSWKLNQHAVSSGGLVLVFDTLHPPFFTFSLCHSVFVLSCALYSRIVFIGSYIKITVVL